MMRSTIAIILTIIIVAVRVGASPLDAAPVKQEDPPAATGETVTTPEVIAAAAAPQEGGGEEPSPREARTLDNDVGNPPGREASLASKLNAKCSQRDVPSCMMLKLIAYMNRLLKKSKIDVGGGLEIEQTSSEPPVEADDVSARSGEVSPSSSTSSSSSDEAELAALLTDKAWNFVKTRRLTWRMLPDADLTVNTAPDDTINVGMSIRPDAVFGTGRGKKKGGIAGGIIAAVVLKAGLLAGLAFKALVLLVGKAILVSKIALVLAIILWLKKLLSQERHVTYEVVAHPHHSHSHVSSGHGIGGGIGGGGIVEGHHSSSGSGGDSYSSGWGRSAEGAHALAYRAHAPSPSH